MGVDSMAWGVWEVASQLEWGLLVDCTTIDSIYSINASQDVTCGTGRLILFEWMLGAFSEEQVQNKTTASLIKKEN